MKKYFLFDCETGGTSTKTSLVTLYGMILHQNLEIVDTIDLKIKPDNGIYRLTAKAMSINRIDIKTHDTSAIFEHQAAENFYNFICGNSFDGGVLIPTGHNLSLDIAFVKKHLLKTDGSSKNCWNRFFSRRCLDTASVANYLILTGKLPQELDCSLQSLAKHFGLNYSGAHNAKFDAELTLNILKKLIGLVDAAPLY